VVVVDVELEGKIFTISFLCGSEFGGVAMMMMRRRRSLCVVLCWGFCDFLPSAAEFAAVRKTQIVRYFCVVVVSFRLCGGGGGGVRW